MIELRRKAAQNAQENPQISVTAATDAQLINSATEGQNAQKRPLAPFAALDGSNYRTAYRVVCNFHERHNPPRLDDDGGSAYWTDVTNDMMDIAYSYDQNPFIIEMLTTVFYELERQFKILKEGGMASANRG